MTIETLVALKIVVFIYYVLCTVQLLIIMGLQLMRHLSVKEFLFCLLAWLFYKIGLVLLLVLVGGVV